MDYVPWMRPGFELGLAMQEIVRKNPGVRAIMMGQHGFISWQDDDKLCYEETLRFIEKASQYIEEKYQAKGGDAKAFGGPKYQSLAEGQPARDVRPDPPVAARPGLPAKALHRDDPGRREDPALCELERRAAPFRTRNELSGSFSAHKDQAALRGLESPDRKMWLR